MSKVVCLRCWIKTKIFSLDMRGFFVEQIRLGGGGLLKRYLKESEFFSESFLGGKIA